MAEGRLRNGDGFSFSKVSEEHFDRFLRGPLKEGLLCFLDLEKLEVVEK